MSSVLVVGAEANPVSASTNANALPQARIEQHLRARSRHRSGGRRALEGASTVRDGAVFQVLFRHPGALLSVGHR